MTLRNGILISRNIVLSDERILPRYLIILAGVLQYKKSVSLSPGKKWQDKFMHSMRNDGVKNKTSNEKDANWYFYLPARLGEVQLNKQTKSLNIYFI